MKIRKWGALLATVCLLGTSGCGAQKNTPESQTDDSLWFLDTTEAPTEPEIEASTESGYPKLSADIPEGAVTKMTRREYRDGKPYDSEIDYLNEYGDTLSELLVMLDGTLDPYKNYCYEYDENGNIVWEREIDYINCEETSYVYDEHGNMTAFEKTNNGLINMTYEGEFDQFGNLMKSVYVSYDEESARAGSPEEILRIVDDYSDCEYDQQGNIVLCREYYQISGELKGTMTYTYDENGKRLSSEMIYADTEKNGYSLSHRYEYDPACGKVTLDDEVKMSAPDTVDYVYTTKREYDGRGRLIRIEHIKGSGDVDVTEFVYEEL